MGVAMAGALGERAVGEGTVRRRDTRSACAQAAKEPARFFLCFSLSKDLHVLLCGGKMFSVSQIQTLNSLFLPSYQTVSQPVLLIPPDFPAQWTSQVSS